MFGQGNQVNETEQQMPKTRKVRCITVETEGIFDYSTYEDVTNVYWSADGTALTFNDSFGHVHIQVGSGTTVSDYYQDVTEKEQTSAKIVRCITVETAGVSDLTIFENVTNVNWPLDGKILSFNDVDGPVNIHIGSGTTIYDDFQYPDNNEEECE
jgi:hypothetical protein